MKSDNLLYQISLTLIPGIGNVLARKLLGQKDHSIMILPFHQQFPADFADFRRRISLTTEARRTQRKKIHALRVSVVTYFFEKIFADYFAYGKILRVSAKSVGKNFNRFALSEFLSEIIGLCYEKR